MLVALHGVWIDNWFTERLYSVTANNYNSLIKLYSKDYYNYSTYKVFCLFTNRC
jgi:hypothetical protein